MVELKLKQTQPTKTDKQTRTAITFFNPIFEKVITVKNKDSKTKFVVTEWTVKLRCGQFYNIEKEKEVEEVYKPLQEGQVIKSLTVVPSGQFFNLVGFEISEGSEKQKSEDPSPSNFNLKHGYLVCLIDNVYPINEQGLEELKKQINKTSKNKVTLEKLKELMVFKFANNLQITFEQIGYGYHFLPVSLVLKLFRAGFEQFCTVMGLVYPNGEFVEFEKRPTNYETLVEKLKEVGIYAGSQVGKS